MAEIEFAALAKQCLDRRIPALDLLDRAVLVWADKRNRDRKTVHWTFSQNDARCKFQRHYRQWFRQKSGGDSAVCPEFVIAGMIFHPSRVES